MGHNADSLELLAVVTAVHHERVGQTLDDGALGLAETLGGVAASRVREVDGRTDLNVVAGGKKSAPFVFALVCVPVSLGFVPLISFIFFFLPPLFRPHCHSSL